MTEMIVEIRHNERAGQRKLKLDKGTKDALADYCRRRWPHHSAKYAAREWDLSVDEARGVVAGKASQTTIDKIWKRGGLLLSIMIHEDVTGQKLADLFHDIREAHDANSDRLHALASDMLFVFSSPARRTPDVSGVGAIGRADPVRRVGAQRHR